MMVGTIVTTVEEGSEVKRGDEFGYFAFGKHFRVKIALDVSIAYAGVPGRWIHDCVLIRERGCSVGRGSSHQRQGFPRDSRARAVRHWQMCSCSERIIGENDDTGCRFVRQDCFAGCGLWMVVVK